MCACVSYERQVFVVILFLALGLLITPDRHTAADLPAVRSSESHLHRAHERAPSFRHLTTKEHHDFYLNEGG